MSTVPLHENCVGCCESADPSTSVNGALTVLAMLTGGHTIDEVVRALCFRHRRDVEIAATEVRKGFQ